MCVHQWSGHPVKAELQLEQSACTFSGPDSTLSTVMLTVRLPHLKPIVAVMRQCKVQTCLQYLGSVQECPGIYQQCLMVADGTSMRKFIISLRL